MDEFFPPRKDKQVNPQDSVNEVLDIAGGVGWDLRKASRPPGDQGNITTTLQSLYALLAVLRSIGDADVLSTAYHPMLEAAYLALGKAETEIDALGQELEYQHQRLDSARDAALAEATKESR